MRRRSTATPGDAAEAALEGRDAGHADETERRRRGSSARLAGDRGVPASAVGQVVGGRAAGASVRGSGAGRPGHPRRLASPAEGGGLGFGRGEVEALAASSSGSLLGRRRPGSSVAAAASASARPRPRSAASVARSAARRRLGDGAPRRRRGSNGATVGLGDRGGDVGQVGRVGHGSRPWSRCGSGPPRRAGARRSRPSRPRRRRRWHRRAGRALDDRAWASISPSSAVLRAAIRASVSSRIRAISAFDHSRIAATSSSAWRRRRRPRRPNAAWISSTTAFASAGKRAIVSSREALGGGLHRPAQVGHELRRPAGRRRRSLGRVGIMSWRVTGAPRRWRSATARVIGRLSAAGSASLGSARRSSRVPARSVCARPLQGSRSPGASRSEP